MSSQLVVVHIPTSGNSAHGNTAITMPKLYFTILPKLYLQVLILYKHVCLSLVMASIGLFVITAYAHMRTKGERF